MQGIVFNGREALLRNDLPIPKPAEGEVLLQVITAGVCKTDLEILKGYMGFTGVIGHEFVGEVITGPADFIGRRVVAEINCPCEVCEFCRRGEGNHCPHRSVLGIDKRDGVFAEYVALPTENLHVIPDDITNDQAAFVEPLAAACRIAEQIQDLAGKRVLVLGDGRLGLLCAMVMQKESTRDILLVGKHPDKLALAAKHGISTALATEFNPVGSDDVGQYDIVIEATGSPAGFDTAMLATKPLGTIVLKSTFAAEGGMNLAPLVINEITVIGSRCGPFDRAIAAMEVGLDPSDFITARFPLTQGLAALEAAGNSKNIKVIIDVK